MRLKAATMMMVGKLKLLKITKKQLTDVVARSNYLAVIVVAAWPNAAAVKKCLATKVEAQARGAVASSRHQAVVVACLAAAVVNRHQAVAAEQEVQARDAVASSRVCAAVAAACLAAAAVSRHQGVAVERVVLQARVAVASKLLVVGKVCPAASVVQTKLKLLFPTTSQAAVRRTLVR